MGCALVAFGSRSRCRFIISRGSGERIGDRRGPRPLRVRDHRRVTARMDGDLSASLAAREVAAELLDAALAAGSSR